MQYTNEELAAKIQAGQTGYILILWEQVQAFVQQQAGRWWRAWRYRRPSMEVADLYQCGYPALVSAVKTYKGDNGLAFIGWFNNYLRTEFAAEVGCRTAKQRGDPLNAAISLDAPAGEDTEDITIGDMVADPEDRYAPIDDVVYQEQIKPVVTAAVDDLPKREQEVLQLRYREGLTLSEIGAQYGISQQRASSIERTALDRIRAGDHMQALSEVLYYTQNFYRGTGFASWQRTGNSAQEAFVIQKERKEAKAKRMEYSATLEDRIRFYINDLGFDRELAEMIVNYSKEA